MNKIVVWPGDGIGPEVMKEAQKAIAAVCEKYGIELDLREADLGGATGIPLPEETLELCRQAEALLLGPGGGPRGEYPPGKERLERGGRSRWLQELKLFAHLRPVVLFKPLRSISPLSSLRWNGGVDMVTVREISGGIAHSQSGMRKGDGAVDMMSCKEREIARIVKVAFDAARKRRQRVTSIDKTGTLACAALWRDVVNVTAAQYPEIELTHMTADHAAMQLVLNPRQFDVILTGSLFGDILADESAALAGSVGLLPCASIGEGVSLYEPAGDSAPEMAGRGMANPIAQILAAALMFDYSLDMPHVSRDIKNAVETALKLGYRPSDIAGDWRPVSTSAMGDAISACLKGETVPDRNQTRHPLHCVLSGFTDQV